MEGSFSNGELVFSKPLLRGRIEARPNRFVVEVATAAKEEL